MTVCAAELRACWRSATNLKLRVPLCGQLKAPFKLERFIIEGKKGHHCVSTGAGTDQG